MTSNTEQQMDAVVMQAGGPPAQALVVRSEPVPVPGPGEVLVEVHAAGVNPFDVFIAGGGLGSPLPMIPGHDFAGVVVRSLRFGGRLTGLHNHEQVEFNPSEIYDHEWHVTGLASVFIDGADGAKIFDQLAVLFDRGLLTPPATRTWPLKDSVEAYQRVQDGAHGIKQVLLPSGGE